MAVADRHLWHTADMAQVVEAGDLRAAFLFAPPGWQVPAPDMERLGLSERDGKIVLPDYEPAVVGVASTSDSRPAVDVAPPAKRRGRKPKASE